jgi:hypothetical protein
MCFDAYVIYLDPEAASADILWDLVLLATRVAAHLADDHVKAHRTACWLYCGFVAVLIPMGLGLKNAEQTIGTSTQVAGSGSEAADSTDYLMLLAMPAMGLFAGIMHGSWGFAVEPKFVIEVFVGAVAIYMACTSVAPANRPVWTVTMVIQLSGFFTMHQVEKVMRGQHLAALKALKADGAEAEAVGRVEEANISRAAGDAGAVARAAGAAVDATRAEGGAGGARQLSYEEMEEDSKALRERIESLQAEKERLEYERQMQQHDAMRARAALKAMEEGASGRPDEDGSVPSSSSSSSPGPAPGSRRLAPPPGADRAAADAADDQEASKPAPLQRHGGATAGGTVGTSASSGKRGKARYWLAKPPASGGPPSCGASSVLSASTDDGAVTTWSMTQAHEASFSSGSHSPSHGRLLSSKPVPRGFLGRGDATETSSP